MLVSITNTFAESSQTEHTPVPSTTTNNAYTPGLGEIMGAIQLRHAKLWFAGQAKNWELAAYELDEIKEAFDDVAKYYSDFKGKPIAKMIEPITNQPVASLQKAIDAKDTAQFIQAFDNLSNACISCHQATEHGFIVIQRPSLPPLTNQRFELTPP
jgi:hypothetical protein